MFFLDRLLQYEESILEEIGTKGRSLPSIMRIGENKYAGLVIGYNVIAFEGKNHVVDMRVASFDIQSGDLLNVIEIGENIVVDGDIYETMKPERIDGEIDISINDLEEAFTKYVENKEYKDGHKMLEYYYSKELPIVLSTEIIINPSFFNYLRGSDNRG